MKIEINTNSVRFNWDKWNLGGKIIFVSFVAATLSLFMPWYTPLLSSISYSGIEQQGWWALLLYIYPVIMLLKNKAINRTWGLVCGLGATLFLLLYIKANAHYIPSGIISYGPGGTVYETEFGAHLFLIASIALAVGVVINHRYTSERKPPSYSFLPAEEIKKDEGRDNFEQSPSPH